MQDIKRRLKLLEERTRLWRIQYAEKERRSAEEHRQRLLEIEEEYERAVKQMELDFCEKMKTIGRQHGGKNTHSKLEQQSAKDCTASTLVCNGNSSPGAVVDNRPSSKPSRSDSLKKLSSGTDDVPHSFEIDPRTANGKTVYPVHLVAQDRATSLGTAMLSSVCGCSNYNTEKCFVLQKLNTSQSPIQLVVTRKCTSRSPKHKTDNRCGWYISKFSSTPFVAFDPGGCERDAKTFLKPTVVNNNSIGVGTDDGRKHTTKVIPNADVWLINEFISSGA